MRLLLILFILLSTNKPLNGQHQFKGSVYGGVVFSQVEGDQNAGYNKAGFSAGLKIKREVSKEWGYATGVGYIQKGSHSKIDKDNPGKLIFVYRYHYVQVPLYLTYTKSKFAAEVGTSLCYLIGGTADLGGSTQNLTGIKKTDFPLHLGAVYELNKNFALGAALEYSILTIVPKTNPNPNYFFRRGVYHNLFNFNLYYLFN